VNIKKLSDEKLLTVPEPNGFEIGTQCNVRNALGTGRQLRHCHNMTRAGSPVPSGMRVLAGQRTAEEETAPTRRR